MIPNTRHFTWTALLVFAMSLASAATVSCQRSPAVSPEVTLFAEDWSDTPAGAFPATLTLVAGKAQIAAERGRKFLKITDSASFDLRLTAALPESYTVEFEMLVPASTRYPVEVRPEAPGARAGSASIAHREKHSVARCGPVYSGAYGTKLTVNARARPADSHATELRTCRIEVAKGGVKVFFADALAVDAVGATLGSGTVLRFYVPTRTTPALIGSIRVTATSGRGAAAPSPDTQSYVVAGYLGSF